jgi:hypothetical protein
MVAPLRPTLGSRKEAPNETSIVHNFPEKAVGAAQSGSPCQGDTVSRRKCLGPTFRVYRPSGRNFKALDFLRGPSGSTSSQSPQGYPKPEPPQPISHISF